MEVAYSREISPFPTLASALVHLASSSSEPPAPVHDRACLDASAHDTSAPNAILPASSYDKSPLGVDVYVARGLPVPSSPPS